MMLHIKRCGWKIALIFLVLAAAGITYFGYETCWFGTFAIAPIPPISPAVTAPGSDSRIAILRGEYTAKFLQKAANYYSHITYWQELAQGVKFPVDIITDAQLEQGLQGHKILILPSSICLSRKERATVLDFATKGGGVISTWATGARDETGAWSGMDFLAKLTGADSFEFPQDSSPWYVSFLAGNPISAGPQGGERIQVDSPERLEAKSISVDGYWSDSRLFPVEPTLPILFQGAAIHRTLGTGRVAWFGFQENAAVAGGNNRAALDFALKNALAWTGQGNICAVNAWPAGHGSAAIFDCDVEEDYFNASYAASALRRLKAQGTFFCLSELVKEDADLIPQLKGVGEVAAHADTHVGLSHAGVVSQFYRVAKSKWRLARLGGGPITGFHPPSDDFNEDTIKTLAATHFRYILIGGENATGAESVLPDVVRVSQAFSRFHRRMDLVRLTRTLDDDLHYSPLGIVGLTTPMIIQRAVADFQIISGLGGLYIFSFHSQGFSAPEYAGIFPPIVGQLRQNGAWIATADDVARWWELRSHLSVIISSLGARGIEIAVNYDGGSTLEGAVLTIFPPRDISSAHLLLEPGRQVPAQIFSGGNNSALTVHLANLNPGANYHFDLLWGQ